MQILVLSINYTPEPTGFAPHVSALCEYMAARDNSVTVLTGFPFAPHWLRWSEYRGKIVARESIRNVDVIRLTHFIPTRPGNALQRIWMEGSFCLMAVVALFAELCCTHWDIILYVGAQPSLAMFARLLSALHHVPYVVAINDLAAQVATDVGIVSNKLLAEMLTNFEYVAYNKASGAMVLCEAFRQTLVEHHFPEERIRLIYNPVDIEIVRPTDGSAFRKAHGLSPDDFIILFSGSMGLKQGLTNVVEAARVTRDEFPQIKWVLVGDGESKRAVEKLISDHGLSEFVRLLPLQHLSQMSFMYSAADILLLNQLRTVKDAVIPSKLTTYMAAGRPVLAAVNSSSQAALLIREARGGLLIAPEDPLALAQGAISLLTRRPELEEMGWRNRQYAETWFDQRKILAAQESFLLEIMSQPKRATTL